MSRLHKVAWREQYVSCLLWSGRSKLSAQRRPSGHEKKTNSWTGLHTAGMVSYGFIGYKDLKVIVPQLLVKDHNVTYHQPCIILIIIIIIIIINLQSSCSHISTSHSLTVWSFRKQISCYLLYISVPNLATSLKHGVEVGSKRPPCTKPERFKNVDMEFVQWFSIAQTLVGNFWLLTSTRHMKQVYTNIYYSIWWFQPIWKILVELDHFPK